MCSTSSWGVEVSSASDWLGARSCALTCRAEPSGSVLRLRGPVAVLLPTLTAAGGAGGADVHFADFEERHHERLLLQRAVAAGEPRLLGADAPPCFRRHGFQKLGHGEVDRGVPGLPDAVSA